MITICFGAGLLSAKKYLKRSLEVPNCSFVEVFFDIVPENIGGTTIWVCLCFLGPSTLASVLLLVSL